MLDRAVKHPLTDPLIGSALKGFQCATMVSARLLVDLVGDIGRNSHKSSSQRKVLGTSDHGSRRYAKLMSDRQDAPGRIGPELDQATRPRGGPCVQFSRHQEEPWQASLSRRMFQGTREDTREGAVNSTIRSQMKQRGA
jgi:hypothetical protein